VVEPNTTISNATGQRLKVIANVTPTFDEETDEHAQIDHVQMEIWHLDAYAKWHKRTVPAELIDEAVPSIYEASTTLRDNETGDIYWYFDAYSEDNGRNRTIGYFLLGESHYLANATGPGEAVASEAPVATLGPYLAAVVVAALVMLFAVFAAPRMVSNMPLVILGTVCATAALIWGAALIPWYEAVIMFGYVFAWAVYVSAPLPGQAYAGGAPRGSGLIAGITGKRFLQGFVLALLGLTVSSAYYVMVGTASVWWPVGFGLGAAGASTYYYSLTHKLRLTNIKILRWFTLKRISLIFSSLASIATILVMFGVI